MDRRRKYDRRQSVESAEVGAIPPPINPLRRSLCGQDLHLFLATYFPDTTGKDPFSPDHCRVIDRIEHCLRHGGRFVNAVYRGFAKTTITEMAALWAALYGYRRYIMICSATGDAGKELIESITKELEGNPLLAEDFPEVCLPFHHLSGRPQRARSQTQGGEPTHIKMGSDTIVLPTVWTDLERNLSTASSGCIIRCKGMEGRIRGVGYKRADGVKVRPDFALCDDIQTDATATNPVQVNKLLDRLRKSILKSAGHQKSMACVINATVIAHDDLVDQLLDHERNPSWQGERIKMVRRWADEHDGLWAEYARIRRTYNHDLPGDQQRAWADATAFYVANREAMDAGCEVSWQHCYDPESERSAIQHAYNLWIDDPPEVFDSECQNEPAFESPAGLERLDSVTIARRLNGYPRGKVPQPATVVTAFIDVHDDLLYYTVCGWTQQMTGFVVDYGTWPDQKKAYFAKRQATKTMKRRFPGRPIEEVREKALEALIEDLCGKEWQRTDGSVCRIDKLMIDSGHAPEEVELVCRRSKYAASLQMSRGRGITAGKLPIREYKRKPGWRFGDDWYIPAGQKRISRTLYIDTNSWKTWLWARLSTPIAGDSSLSFFGKTNQRATDHRLIADHIVSEKPKESFSDDGRCVIEWTLPPGIDNHYLDCLVGCGVAASLMGCSLKPQAPKTSNRRRRVLDAAKKKNLMNG